MIMHIAHAVAEKNGSWENLVRLEKRFEEKEREEEKRKSAAQAEDEYKEDYSNYFNELEYDEDDREALESIIDSIIIRQ
jgi:predicted Holliday junction resolvase-like endonuclease